MPRRSHDSARHGIVRFGSLVRTGSCRARTKNRADNLRQSICSLSFFLALSFLAHLLSHSLSPSLPHAPTKRVSCFTEGLFYSAHFPFYRGRCAIKSICLVFLPRSRFSTISHLFALFLLPSFSFPHTHSLTHALSLSLYTIS